MEMKDLENKIKQDLEKRRISPSKAAWSRLEDRLESSERQTKPLYWWLGIAAAFLIGLLLSGWFFSFNTIKSRQSKVSNAQKQQVPFEVGNSLPSIPAPISIKTKLRRTDTVEKPPKNYRTTPLVDMDSSPVREKPYIPAKNQTEPLLVQEAREKSSEEKLKDAIVGIANKVANKEDTHEVTDAEIESLLREAQLQIRAQEAFKEAENEVDAMALLKTVEEELDRSFREKVFDAIHTGLRKAKTMMASRER